MRLDLGLKWRLQVFASMLLCAIVLLTSAALAKPTLPFSLPQGFQGFPSLQSFTQQIIEQRSVRQMKSYSGKRISNDSLIMIYFHDRTIAVTELGPQKLLLGCELIEIYNDKEGQHLLDGLSKINRPLAITFDEMLKLMNQCEYVDKLRYKSAIKGINSDSNSATILNNDDDDDDNDDNNNKTDNNNGNGNGNGNGNNERRSSSSTTNINTSNNQNQNQDSVTLKLAAHIFPRSPFTLLSGIIPGTKWCGTGDIAETYSDLGSEITMDRCCRQHDLCPVKIRAYQNKYDLMNDSLYTKSHCICDDLLYSCLKQTNTSASQLMGSIYFNLVQVPCLDGRDHHYKFRAAKEGF